MKRVAFLSVFGVVAAFALLQVEECTPGDAELSMLELRIGDEQGENVIEDFVPTGILYSANLPPKPETAVLIVEAKDPNATIQVKHDGQVIPLQNGAAELRPPFQGSQVEIRVSPPGGDPWTYQVHIERGRSIVELLTFVDARMGWSGDGRPGLAIAVLGPQGVAFEATYGTANIEESIPIGRTTPFYLASVSKQFTASAVMILHQEDKLELDDLISAYIPDAPPSWGSITIHHLLTHQSGIPNFLDRISTGSPGWTAAEVLSWAVDQPLDFLPGEQVDYSNTGYVLLALIVEAASGQSFPSFLEQEIFAPLGMESSSVPLIYPPGIPDRARGYEGTLPHEFAKRGMGHAAQYSSLADLEKWEMGLRGSTILSEQTQALMFSPHVDWPWDPECAYGYGWLICDRPGEPQNIWHDGRSVDAFRALVTRAPEDDVAVVMASNAKFGPALADNVATGLAYDLWRYYLGLDPI